MNQSRSITVKSKLVKSKHLTFRGCLANTPATRFEISPAVSHGCAGSDRDVNLNCRMFRPLRPLHVQGTRPLMMNVGVRERVHVAAQDASRAKGTVTTRTHRILWHFVTTALDVNRDIGVVEELLYRPPANRLWPSSKRSAERIPPWIR